MMKVTFNNTRSASSRLRGDQDVARPRAREKSVATRADLADLRRRPPTSHQEDPMKRPLISVLGLCALLSGCGGAAATSEPASTTTAVEETQQPIMAAGELTPGGTVANFGVHNLTSGFMPDPYTVDVVSGGGIDASTSNAGAGCAGWVTGQPDVIVNFEEMSGFLRFAFRPERRRRRRHARDQRRPGQLALQRRRVGSEPGGRPGRRASRPVRHLDRQLQLGGPHHRAAAGDRALRRDAVNPSLACVLSRCARGGRLPGR
jgi:hypothetical protein